MPITYITFGQSHVHRVNNRTFDADCIAAIECADAEEGRKKAFEYFGPKFAFEYHGKEFEQVEMKYFPRGIMFVEHNTPQPGSSW